MKRVLIAGQGISGTLLAAELLQEGCSILLVDSCEKDTSSRVAAGMIHPVTGRRITKSWRIDEFMPFATDIYRKHEQFLGTSFFHDVKTLELYRDEGHRNDWMARSIDPAFHYYLGKECLPDEVPAGIEKGLGGQWLLHGGWLDTEKFLDSWRTYFIENNLFLSARIQDEEITFNHATATYRGQEFDVVVDCRGHASSASNWFGYLPFNMAKGEVLRLKCNALSLDHILHKSVKLIPDTSSNEFICGATFSWEKFDTIPTEEGKNALASKLQKLLTLPYQITQHRAGIRPATDDRRPFIGFHPEIKNLCIFNGLGAKGVLIGPWMARELKDLLIHSVPVSEEVDIARVKIKAETA